MNSNLTSCHNEIGKLRTAMKTMSQRLKTNMDNMANEIRTIYTSFLICELQKQRRKTIKIHIVSVKAYENSHEQTSNRPVKFLRLVKKVQLPQISDTPSVSQHCELSLTQEINIGDLIKLISKIQIVERRKRKLTAGNRNSLTLMPSPVLQHSIKVAEFGCISHISVVVNPNRAWVSGYNNKLILTDILTGEYLHGVEDPFCSDIGLHTVNSEGELIYITNRYDIKKNSLMTGKQSLQ